MTYKKVPIKMKIMMVSNVGKFEKKWMESIAMDIKMQISHRTYFFLKNNSRAGIDYILKILNHFFLVMQKCQNENKLGNSIKDHINFSSVNYIPKKISIWPTHTHKHLRQDQEWVRNLNVNNMRSLITKSPIENWSSFSYLYRFSSNFNIRGTYINRNIKENGLYTHHKSKRHTHTHTHKRNDCSGAEQ